MLVKLLGAIDIVSALVFLSIIFGFSPIIPIILFCAGLLLLKGLLTIWDINMFSIIDVLSSIVLILSIFFALPAFLIWIPAFLLLAKGIVSFI